jgi:hypothetical protein
MTTRDFSARILVRHANPQADATRLLVLREARRAALSPILLVACAMACWSMWREWIHRLEPPLENDPGLYISLFYNAWPLLLGSFLLGAWTLARERPRTTRELFTAAPLSSRRRTAARLAVATVPALAAVPVVAVQAVLVARAGGVPLGAGLYQVQVVPTVVEWASIPVATVASYTAGAAVYSLTRTRAVTALVGAFVTLFGVMPFWLWIWPPAVFISPIGYPVREHELTTLQALDHLDDAPLIEPDPTQPEMPWLLYDTDPAISAAHSVALLGMAALFAALTLGRTAPDRRNHRLAWAGAAVVGAASAAQIAAYLL